MAFPVAAGGANYSGNFIPEIWSSKLVENFYDASVLTAVSNTDFEGEIKAHGDKVQIRLTPEVTVRPYQKGMNLTVERPDKPKITLEIDQGEYCPYEDDVDKVQADINLMDEWSKDASEKMKLAIDAKVLTNILPDISTFNMGATAGRISQTSTRLHRRPGPSHHQRARPARGRWNCADEANAPVWSFPDHPRVMAGLIKKSDLKDASLTGDSSSVLRNGRLGMIDRFTLYTSHNLNSVVDSTYRCFSVIGGHKMGLTFASQMTEMESLRAESTFGNIIRGLQVYGYRVVKGEALTKLYVRQ